MFHLGTIVDATPSTSAAIALTPEIMTAQQAAAYEAERERRESCSFYQFYNSCLPNDTPAGMASTMECKGGCQTTPLSLLRAPGLLIGRGLKKIFTSQDADQLEMVGHIATALVLIGGTVYLFNRGK